MGLWYFVRGGGSECMPNIEVSRTAKQSRNVHSTRIHVDSMGPSVGGKRLETMGEIAIELQLQGVIVGRCSVQDYGNVVKVCVWCCELSLIDEPPASGSNVCGGK